MRSAKTFLIQDIYAAGDRIGWLATDKKPLLARIRKSFNKATQHKPLTLSISNRGRRAREIQLSELISRLRDRS